jgi:hypothetical protein
VVQVSFLETVARAKALYVPPHLATIAPLRGRMTPEGDPGDDDVLIFDVKSDGGTRLSAGELSRNVVIRSIATESRPESAAERRSIYRALLTAPRCRPCLATATPSSSSQRRGDAPPIQSAS